MHQHRVLPLVQVQLAGLVAQFRDGGGAVGTVPAADGLAGPGVVHRGKHVDAVGAVGVLGAAVVSLGRVDDIEADLDQKGLTIVDFGAVVRAAAGVGIVQQVGGLLVIGRVDHAGHAHAGGDIADGVLVQYRLPVVGRALGRYRQLRQVFRVNRFTAVGVQRGGCCQGFRFRRGSGGGFRGRCGAPSQHPGAKQHCRQTGGTAGNGRHR